MIVGVLATCHTRYT